MDRCAGGLRVALSAGPTASDAIRAFLSPLLRLRAPGPQTSADPLVEQTYALLRDALEAEPDERAFDDQIASYSARPSRT